LSGDAERDVEAVVVSASLDGETPLRLEIHEVAGIGLLGGLSVAAAPEESAFCR
jgi:hypothetical protein